MKRTRQRGPSPAPKSSAIAAERNSNFIFVITTSPVGLCFDGATIPTGMVGFVRPLKIRVHSMVAGVVLCSVAMDRLYATGGRRSSPSVTRRDHRSDIRASRGGVEPSQQFGGRATEVLGHRRQSPQAPCRPRAEARANVAGPGAEVPRQGGLGAPGGVRVRREPPRHLPRDVGAYSALKRRCGNWHECDYCTCEMRAQVTVLQHGESVFSSRLVGMSGCRDVSIKHIVYFTRIAPINVLYVMVPHGANRNQPYSILSAKHPDNPDTPRGTSVQVPWNNS